MNEWKEHQLDDKKFQKSDFCKKLFKIDETDVDISFKKEPYGTNKLIKYFIAYNDKDVIKPLCIKLPQLDLLNTLIVIRQCLLRLLVKTC